MRHRAPTRALVVAAVALVALAPMAAAHVTVNPGEAEKGGFARLTFRVPNERDDATTTTVEVNLPEEAPFTSVRVKPKQGWTYTMETRTLDTPIDNNGEQVTEVVSKITWTGGPIGTTEFEEFDVSVGRMPEEGDYLLFPSIQTYSSGEVVRWIDEPVDGGEEPEHPAPLLTLVDPEPEEGEDAAAPADDGAAEGEQAASVTNAASQDDVDSANTLATVGLVVGVLGLAVAIFAVVRGRKTA
ncbi:MAG TPA: YcnI family protein [Acidimicrobiales bacterium]|nr:YcnI family protein [Acidimicrobiales bacterium]